MRGVYPCVTAAKARISALDTAASFDLPVKYLRTCRCLSYAPKKAESDTKRIMKLAPVKEIQKWGSNLED